MNGFRLRTCSDSAQECVVVTAKKTQGSQIKPLHVFKNALVTIVSKKTGKETQLQADYGYVDLNENQLTIYKRDSHTLQETTLNLTTFRRTSLAHGDL